jgi:hypothetical protein
MPFGWNLAVRILMTLVPRKAVIVLLLVLSAALLHEWWAGPLSAVNDGIATC